MTKKPWSWVTGSVDWWILSNASSLDACLLGGKRTPSCAAMEVPSLGHASTPAVNKYVYDLHTRHDNNLRLRSIEDHMARIEKLFLSLLSFLVPKCQLVWNNNYAEPFRYGISLFPLWIIRHTMSTRIAIIPIHFCHFWSHHTVPSLHWKWTRVLATYRHFHVVTTIEWCSGQELIRHPIHYTITLIN